MYRASLRLQGCKNKPGWAAVNNIFTFISGALSLRGSCARAYRLPTPSRFFADQQTFVLACIKTAEKNPGEGKIFGICREDGPALQFSQTQRRIKVTN